MDRFQAGSMANMTAKPISHSRRRHLRFSVRGLLVLVVIIAVWLGWIVRSAARPARRRRGDSKGWRIREL